MQSLQKQLEGILEAGLKQQRRRRVVRRLGVVLLVGALLSHQSGHPSAQRNIGECTGLRGLSDHGAEELLTRVAVNVDLVGQEDSGRGPDGR